MHANTIRVVIVTTYLSGGGAAVAAVRQALALVKHTNLRVSVLYLYDPDQVAATLPIETVCWANNWRRKLLARFCFVAERFQIWWHNGKHRRKIFHISTGLWGFDISGHPLVKQANIVHLHWICNGFIRVSALGRLRAEGRHVVWTLHDMWPFTAVSPHLSDPKTYQSPWQAKEVPLVQKVWKAKQKAYQQLRPLWAGCSRWITMQAARSPLTQQCRLVTVPNPVDMELFSPRSTTLPKPLRRILFVAVRPDDERKGFHQMLECLTLLAKWGVFNEGVEIACVGMLSEQAKQLLSPYPTVLYGYVKTPLDMACIYREADILVVPSLAENLPNTIMESLSCGTPVVAFETGGIPEMITNGVTGKVCTYGAGEALARGVMELLQLPTHEYAQVRQACHTWVREHYSYAYVARLWADIYEQYCNASYH